MTPDQIKALRIRLGLTQQEFADALGLKRRAITYWEAGTPGRDPKGPSLILLHMLARHPRRLKEVLELSDVIARPADVGSENEHAEKDD